MLTAFTSLVTAITLFGCPNRYHGALAERYVPPPPRTCQPFGSKSFGCSSFPSCDRFTSGTTRREQGGQRQSCNAEWYRISFVSLSRRQWTNVSSGNGHRRCCRHHSSVKKRLSFPRMLFNTPDSSSSSSVSTRTITIDSNNDHPGDQVFSSRGGRSSSSSGKGDTSSWTIPSPVQIELSNGNISFPYRIELELGTDSDDQETGTMTAPRTMERRGLSFFATREKNAPPDSMDGTDGIANEAVSNDDDFSDPSSSSSSSLVSIAPSSETSYNTTTTTTTTTNRKSTKTFLIRHLEEKDLNQVVSMCVKEFGTYSPSIHSKHLPGVAVSGNHHHHQHRAIASFSRKIMEQWSATVENRIFRCIVWIGLSQRVKRRKEGYSDTTGTGHNNRVVPDHNVICLTELKPSNDDGLGSNGNKDNEEKEEEKETIVGIAELSLQPPNPEWTSPPFVLPLFVKKFLCHSWKRVLRTSDEDQDKMAAPVPTAYVSNVLVTDEYRNHGCGKTLMAATEGLAKSWDQHSISLHVDADPNSGGAAQQLYRALGYQPVVDESLNQKFNWMGPEMVNRGLYIVDGVPLLYMRKELSKNGGDFVLDGDNGSVETMAK